MVRIIENVSPSILICLLLVSMVSGILLQIPNLKALTGPFTGKIYDEGVDTDADGLFDLLQIGVEINAPQSGYYYFYASGLSNGTYYNSSTVNVWDSKSVYLDVGMQVVNLSFFGPSIYASKILDASQVNTIQINYPYGSEYWSYVPLLKTYSYFQFDFHALLTGNIKDQGIDTDADGYYNYLEVSVEINVSNPGDYSINAWGLTNPSPNWTWIDVPAYSSSHLDQGIQEISIDFSGGKIYASGVNFTQINSMSLGEIAQDPEGYMREWNLDSQDSVSLSREYSFAEFDPLAKLTGKISDEGVDTDGDGRHDYLQVGVEVEVFEPGTYQVSVWGLANSTVVINGTRGMVSIGDSVYQYLEVGLNVVNVSFYGPAIYASAVDPSVVISIDLYSMSPEWLHLGHMDDTPLSRTYPHTEFDTHAYLTGKIYDKGVDTDGSGKYDYLEVGVEVNVEDSGTYTINVESLVDETEKSYYEGYYPRYTSLYLEAGTRVVNFSFYGPAMSAQRFDPAAVMRITLTETYRPAYLQTLTKVPLSRQYSYTEFDAALRDMEARFIVYPNGSVLMAQSLNYTHMEYPNRGPQVEGSLSFEKNGDLTQISTTGKVTLPQELYYMYLPFPPYYYYGSGASQWPFNSSVVSAQAKYSEGTLTAGVNASSVLPIGVSSQYPFNSSDFTLDLGYSNGMLNGEIDASTTLPPQVSSMFPFDTTDFSLEADYSSGILKGNVTFHIISGFPIGDVTFDFQADTSEIAASGDVVVIYGTYDTYPPIEINETVVDTLIQNIVALEGTGPNSLYNMTNGAIEFLETSTITKTPFPDPTLGATIAFNVTFQGDLVKLLTIMLTGSSSSPDYQTWYDLIDSAIASVQSGSIVMGYSRISASASLKITFKDNLKLLVKDIVDFANQTISKSYPPYMVPSALLQLRFINSTFNSIDSFNIQLTYSSSTKTFDLKSSIVDKLEMLWQDTKNMLLETVPIETRALYEKLLNTTYCTIKSAEASVTYENGAANFQAQATIEGDFNKEINYVKTVYVTEMDAFYKNHTMPVPWQWSYINQTMIDASRMKFSYKMTDTSMYESFESLMVSPPTDPIDARSFKLQRFFNLTSSPYESPRSGEQQKITLQGGHNGTNIITLLRTASVPAPDFVSDDNTIMIWNNQTISNVKDITFSLQYYTEIIWGGQTYPVITASNGTVSPITFDQPNNQIIFTIDGPTGTVGYANVSIPKSLLDAPPEGWIIVLGDATILYPDYQVTETATRTFLYFTFTLSSPLDVRIVGVEAVPEFSESMIVPLIVVLTILALVIAKRKRPKRKQYP